MLLVVATFLAAASPSPAAPQDLLIWHWGELFYEKTYATTLDVTNDCDSVETLAVRKSASLNPYLAMPDHVTVPAHSSVTVDVTITTGPPPPTIVQGPGAPVMPYGIFTDLATLNAHVELLHSSGPWCTSNQKDYRVEGHIHLDPTPDRPLVDPCLVWWFTGNKPAGLTKDCTETFRALAQAYISHTLGVFIRDDPDAWDWLPSTEELLAMSEEELLGLKNRAERQIAGVQVQGGGEPAVSDRGAVSGGTR